LHEPELRLSSTPPLDDSNILSLIVFNTSINELSATQQQELAVRAGTLAAGFLTTPLLNAFKQSIGVDILDVELQSQSGQTAPRVTVGDEIAPGLIARFSRQFGELEYSEACIEYVLSRMFRIRATFWVAGTVLARSPFRRGTCRNRFPAVLQLLTVKRDRSDPPASHTQDSQLETWRSYSSIVATSVRSGTTVTIRSKVRTSA
jgi:hypothetical protein